MSSGINGAKQNRRKWLIWAIPAAVLLCVLAAVFLRQPGGETQGQSEQTAVDQITVDQASASADDSCLFYEVFEDHVLITGCENGVSSVDIPAFIEGKPVTLIDGEGFKDCDELQSITIPGSVNDLLGSFAYCKNLSSITVNGENTAYASLDGVLYAEDMKALICFPSGKAGDSFTIPDGVTSILSGAFYGCEKLNSIRIPDSVTYIGDWAFYRCDKLSDVYYSGSQEQWENIPVGVMNDSLSNAAIHYNT